MIENELKNKKNLYKKEKKELNLVKNIEEK